MQISWEINIICIVQAVQCLLQKDLEAYSAYWTKSLNFASFLKSSFLDFITKKKRTLKILSKHIQKAEGKQHFAYCISYNLKDSLLIFLRFCLTTVTF